jgi:hypothetical protein
MFAVDVSHAVKTIDDYQRLIGGIILILTVEQPQIRL